MVSYQGGGGPGGLLPSGGSANAAENDMQRKAAAIAAAIAARSAKTAPVPAAPSAIPNGLDLALSASEMARNEFAPQFDLLEQLKKQATQNYTKAGADVGSMYDALSKAIRGHEGAIKGQYADSGKNIGGAYNQAIAQTNASFSDSRNQIAELAKRLGITAGLPSALSDGVEQQGRLAGLLAANKANQQGVNTLLGNNDVAYNRETADTAGLAGVNARADFKGRLMSALQDLGNKGLELQGNEAATENKYSMSIKDMMQQAQLAKEKMAQDAELKQAQLMLDQSKYKLDSDKFAWDKNKPGPAQDTSKLGAYETLSSLAKQLYGNDVSANNAAQAIEDTFTRGAPGQDLRWTDANEFARDVTARNKGATDYRQLQQLALAFYDKIAGGANKTFGANLP